MKQAEYIPIQHEDDFWTEQIPFFTAHFSSYYTNPQKVWGRFHTSEEQYINSPHEIIPIKEKKGQRTYVMMQPYVLEPKLTLTIGLYDKQKHFADQDSAIEKTIGTPQHQGFREAQVGNAQAWITIKTERSYCGSVFLMDVSANIH